jgi:hypothetical protein
MSQPAKEAPRSDSLPAEIRNRIYKYLFATDSAFYHRKDRFMKHKRTQEYLDPEEDEDIQRLNDRAWPTYVFPTALLRTNLNIHNEARAVLYNNNLLVLMCLNADDGFLIVSKVCPEDPENEVPFRFLPREHRCHHARSVLITIIMKGGIRVLLPRLSRLPLWWLLQTSNSSAGQSSTPSTTIVSCTQSVYSANHTR